jgi:hypothetical protein
VWLFIILLFVVGVICFEAGLQVAGFVCIIVAFVILYRMFTKGNGR